MEPQAPLPHDPASDTSDTIVAAGKESIDDDTVIEAGGEATAALQIEKAELTPQAPGVPGGDAASTATMRDVEPREEAKSARDETREDATPTGEKPSDTHASGDELSPSVRRLIRQYNLDVTRIHGTGPEGRIRVADVVALIGTRSDAPGDAALRYAAATARKTQLSVQDKNDDGADQGNSMSLQADDDREARAELAAAASQDYGAEEPQPVAAVVAATAAAPVTTVFECDLGRVLAHRKRQAQHGVEPTITSYYLVACGTALASVPEVGADANRVGEIGVWLATSDGDAKPLLIDIAAEPPGTPPGARVQGVDLRIRAAATSAVTAAAADPDDDPFADAKTSMLVHQHGASGSLLATATPLGPGHAASLGVGRVRKQIVVRNVDGDEGPRVAALAYLTLSFDPRRVTLPRANRFMSELVRALEQWPED